MSEKKERFDTTFKRDERGWKTKRGKWYFLDRKSPVPEGNSSTLYEVEVVKEFGNYGFVRILGPVFTKRERVEENVMVVRGKDDQSFRAYYVRDEATLVKRNIRWDFEKEDVKGFIDHYRVKWELVKLEKFLEECRAIPKKFYTTESREYDKDSFIFKAEVERLLSMPLNAGILKEMSNWERDLIYYYDNKRVKRVMFDWVATELDLDSLFFMYERVRLIKLKLSDIRRKIEKFEEALAAVDGNGFVIRFDEERLPERLRNKYDFFTVNVDNKGNIVKVVGHGITGRHFFGEEVMVRTWEREVPLDDAFKNVIKSSRTYQDVMRVAKEFGFSAERIKRKLNSLRKIEKVLSRKEKMFFESLKSDKMYDKFEDVKRHPVFVYNIYYEHHYDGFYGDPDIISFLKVLDSMSRECSENPEDEIEACPSV